MTNSFSSLSNPTTVKRRYYEGLRGWLNMFAIPKFRYIEVHFHILFLVLGQGKFFSLPRTFVI